MPQNADSPHEGFEEELGTVLRRTGDGFDVDDRRELVEGGLRRGRRRLFRRRLAVTGGVLALAAVGIGGVWGGSLLSPSGAPDHVSVAGAPKTPKPTAGASDPTGPVVKKPLQAQIAVKDLAAVLQANTPAGTWEIENLEGKEQYVQGVYDDGRGKAGVSLGLHRAHGTGEAVDEQVTCPSRTHVSFDDCSTERLPNGSRLMIFQGYEYPDRREETKAWRAVLLTKDRFLIDVTEYNAAAEKGAAISRENPPFTPAQLKALVTADAWQQLLKQLPAEPKTKRPGAGSQQPPGELGGPAVQSTLLSLLPTGLKVADKGADSGYGFVVVDDGKGESLVQINVQPNMGGVVGDLFGSGDVTTLPDGRLVKLTQQPGEKGGAGVVWWTADTITPDGFRVVVSAFNTGAQHEDATRAEPALSMEQLKTIALSTDWLRLQAPPE
ncbi:MULTISPECIES: hypothetical protein [Streptomyces]|uniref:hypothetical protein n=1 Tax=Streptomyces TaxID=1883 RepID=UPI001C8BE6D3|nr:hypothetical protein [Streptomyces lateritius]MBX9424455.1 hypothetical protein [Streptomyces lateritius]